MSEQDNSLLSGRNVSVSERKMYWNWIRAQFNPGDIHLHGTRINSVGSSLRSFNFFLPPSFFFGSAVTKIESRREIWWLSSHVKEEPGSTCNYRSSDSPSCQGEESDPLCETVHGLSAWRERNWPRRWLKNIEWRAGGRASGGFAIVSDTRDFCERRNFWKLFRARVLRVLWREDEISLCLCAHVVLRLAPNTLREVDL